MYSGVLALGIGDAVASIVGKLRGKVKWPGISLCGCVVRVWLIIPYSA